jgi:hypothetical protein
VFMQNGFPGPESVGVHPGPWEDSEGTPKDYQIILVHLRAPMASVAGDWPVRGTTSSPTRHQRFEERPLRRFLSRQALRRRTSPQLQSGAATVLSRRGRRNGPALDRTDRTALIQPTRVTKIRIHPPHE